VVTIRCSPGYRPVEYTRSTVAGAIGTPAASPAAARSPMVAIVESLTAGCSVAHADKARNKACFATVLIYDYNIQCLNDL
jgi:hypothetical protein